MRRGIGALALVALAACEPQNERGIEMDPGYRTSRRALRACADGPTVDGIDVSKWQGAIDWGAVGRSHIKYAIVRIGDGTYEDERFEENWRGAREAGLVRGSYQFFRANIDPVRQADIVVRKVGRLGPGDLPVVLDLEGQSIQGRSAAQVADAARAWLARVEEGTGKRPIIYTGFYVWRDQVGSADLGDYPLWIAAYVEGCPNIPDPWQRWHFWQTSDSGRVPGIAGNVDTDLWNGTLEDLQRFADAEVQPAYAAEPSRQSFPLAGEGAVELTVGESAEGWFDLRNTGAATWGADTRLAPTPRDAPSPLGPEGWLSDNRISGPLRDTPPGSIGRFPVILTAHEAGEFTQTFGLVEEGVTWFADSGGPADDLLAVRVVVRPGPDGGGVRPPRDAAVTGDADAPPDASAADARAPDMGSLGDATFPDGNVLDDAGVADDDAAPAPPRPRILREARYTGGCATAPATSSPWLLLLAPLLRSLRRERRRRWSDEAAHLDLPDRRGHRRERGRSGE